MKKNSRLIYLLLIILISPFSWIAGQHGINEQKIKVVVNDGSGNKVVVDTVFKDGVRPDSIKTKDGTVIYLKHPGDEKDLRDHSGKDHFFVAYSDDGKNKDKETKTVTIIKSDSVQLNREGDSGDVMFYSNSNEGSGGEKYSVITRSSKTHGDKGEIIYINKGKASEKEDEKTFDIYISDNQSESKAEKTRYVIAKDGMVVTVEGTDETRTKALVKEIENKLGVNSDGNDKNEQVKAESKKPAKK